MSSNIWESIEIINAVKDTFASTSGQQVLTALKSFCYVDAMSFHPTSPHITSFNEGMRLVYNTLNHIIERPLKEQISTHTPIPHIEEDE